jgi:hypothetical protein
MALTISIWRGHLVQRNCHTEICQKIRLQALFAIAESDLCPSFVTSDDKCFVTTLVTQPAGHS